MFTIKPPRYFTTIIFLEYGDNMGCSTAWGFSRVVWQNGGGETGETLTQLCTIFGESRLRAERQSRPPVGAGVGQLEFYKIPSSWVVLCI
jgi:hypothetical protein